MGLVDAFRKALGRTSPLVVSQDRHGEGAKEDAVGAELRVRELTAGELLEEMKKSGNRPLLLDIREPYERAQGFIPDSLHIAMNTVPYRLAELDREQDIVVYCAHGNRSHGVTGWLMQQGYKARSLKGGIADWQRQHGPVDRG